MDKLVKRVTVVEGAGEDRHAKVVYKGKEDEAGELGLHPYERAVRHWLKADLIRAQEAYDRHLKSASKGSTDWLFDAPSNFIKSFRKAEKEERAALRALSDEDEEEGDRA